MQLDYSLERFKIVQTNSESYKKEIAAIREKNQAYTTTIVKHEQNVNKLREVFWSTSDIPYIERSKEILLRPILSPAAYSVFCGLFSSVAYSHLWPILVYGLFSSVAYYLVCGLFSFIAHSRLWPILARLYAIVVQISQTRVVPRRRHLEFN